MIVGWKAIHAAIIDATQSSTSLRTVQRWAAQTYVGRIPVGYRINGTPCLKEEDLALWIETWNTLRPGRISRNGKR